MGIGATTSFPRWGRRRGTLVAGLTAAALLLGTAGSADAANRPVTPEFVGVQDDTFQPPEPNAWGAARVWAAWCTVQPDATVDVEDAAQKYLDRIVSTYAAASVTRLTLSLGHPAPWVFGDHRRAWERGKYLWYCQQRAANTAFPSASSLRAGEVGHAYEAYVSALVEAAHPYLEANPANTLVLQAWNEPNLRSGGTLNRRIPGAARTWKQASASLREQEVIMRRVAQRLIPGRYEITSPAMYGKPKPLSKQYYADQARRRTVDSISLNFYTLKQRSVNASLALWRKKAARAKRLVTKHKHLRRIPIWISETNHNLSNDRPTQANVDGVWATQAAQTRMVEVTTMEALRLGYAGIEWYQGAPRQTAVNTRPGTAATLASMALMEQIMGRSVVRCRTKRGTTTCVLSARADSERITVRWSSKGTAGVRFSG